MHVKEGDRVKEIQVLAQLDPSDTQNKRELLELQRKQVQADWGKMQEGPKTEEVKLLEESVHQQDYVPQIFIGQEAVIEGDAIGGERLAARVTKMAAVAKASSETNQDKKAVVAVTLEVDKGIAKLLPGFHVDVNFVSHEAKGAVQVPIGAVKRNADGSSYVWTVQGQRAVRVPVETGMKNETSIEVKKGLQAGSQVIVNVPDSLRDEQKVAVVP